MSGTWQDLRHELHVERRRAHAEHRDFDVADAVAAVAHWIGIPEPRRTPDDLLGAILNGPRCVCGKCDGR